MKAGAIIPAAGAGRRMGGVRKALMQVAGKPLLQHSVEVLRGHPGVDVIVVALPAEDVSNAPEFLRHPDVIIVAGGDERGDSVRLALAAMPNSIDAVLVHDAARPLITPELIDRVLAEVALGHSATVGIPVTDTLHEVGESSKIERTPDRARFWRAQTPQAFPREVLELAFARSATARATDEAGMVAAGGWLVRVVSGEHWNIKVTTPDDLARVEAVLRERGA